MIIVGIMYHKYAYCTLFKFGLRIYCTCACVFMFFTSVQLIRRSPSLKSQQNLAWGHCMTSEKHNSESPETAPSLSCLSCKHNSESRWLSDIGPGGTTDQTLRESKRTTHHTVRNPTAQCKDLRATQLLL